MGGVGLGDQHDDCWAKLSMMRPCALARTKLEWGLIVWDRGLDFVHCKRDGTVQAHLIVSATGSASEDAGTECVENKEGVVQEHWDEVDSRNGTEFVVVPSELPAETVSGSATGMVAPAYVYFVLEYAPAVAEATYSPDCHHNLPWQNVQLVRPSPQCRHSL